MLLLVGSLATLGLAFGLALAEKRSHAEPGSEVKAPIVRHGGWASREIIPMALQRANEREVCTIATLFLEGRRRDHQREPDERIAIMLTQPVEPRAKHTRRFGNIAVARRTLRTGKPPFPGQPRIMVYTSETPVSDSPFLSGPMCVFDEREPIAELFQRMLTPNLPALILAPMEGVTDAPMRALQGETGAFTFAVSEFLRVSQVVPHKNFFYRHIPELRNGGRTPSGLPVQVQILGGNAGRMAEAGFIAHQAGAMAIDINFGCPARTVNRHDGGATLLQHPKRIREIVRAVRDALPGAVPVSAKLRLGWDSVEPIFENAAMAAEGGAAWLTIHARTRLAGYCPPVHWALIGRVRERLGIPIVANGDIWTIEGFRQCRQETGCQHFMLGRGALADPLLPYRVAAELGIASDSIPPGDVDWIGQMRRLVEWTRHYSDCQPDRALFRLKQWLNLAATFGKFSRFDAIKRACHVDELFVELSPAV